MRFLATPLLLLLFSLTLFSSCEENIFIKKKKNRSEVEEKPFDPHFNTISKSYKRKTKRVIKSFFNHELKRNFNGQFLVAKNGEILYETFEGYANYENKEKLDFNTPMHLASVSKTVTSMAIMRLVDQKKVLLDEDIRNYLPEIPYEGISIRMLLNHRSGIPYYGYFTYGVWPSGKTLTNKDILLLLKKHKFPLNFKVNDHFAYCNTNFALLALIIEKVTNMRFPDAMKSLIFKPLKMNHSFILDYNQDHNKVSQSYNPGWSRYAFDYLDAVYGDKNMYSTVHDLLKLDKATYCDSFLSKKAKSEIFKGYSYEHKGTKNYGLGFRMFEEKGKNTYFYHTGWWHGNTTCYASLRADTVCILALSNVFDRRVYRINLLSTQFGNYPFETVDY